MTSKLRFLVFLYFLFSFSLFIYSYGYLDFNLTLFSNPYFLKIIAPLQHLVYFERFQSVKVFVFIFTGLFLLYFATLSAANTTRLAHFPWKFVLILIVSLTFAYPMLSYDLFNYMFHGKILWFYHMNPHLHAPLEFTGDLWLRFMRWVHTPSAYGPVFTVIESPAYLLGLGKFVPVLYLMKITMSAFFVWCIFLVGQLGKILGQSPQKVVFNQLLLALNPFLILDIVINGHNDAVMIALFLLALIYSLKKRARQSYLSLLLSIGTKFITALTVPLYFIRSPRLKILFSVLILLLPVLVSPGRFQPWYLIWALIPAVLLDSDLIRNWVILASLGGIIFYLPYIATGFWVNSLSFVGAIIYFPIIISLVLNFNRTALKNHSN